MKITKLIVLAIGLATGLSAGAQVFGKNDRKVDLTVGVGVVGYQDKSRPTFDQHLSMEWGVAKIADKFTLGVGFQVNNAYGGSFDGTVLGEYDYHYTRYYYGKVYSYKDKRWNNINEQKDGHRKGNGTATATVSREDVDVLATAALHYSPVNRLDTYLKIGAGVGYMNYLYSNFQNQDGFHEANVYEKTDSKIEQTTSAWQYNDLDHTEWQKAKSKIVPAFSVYLGATYMINSRWGVDMQVGLINANIKSAEKGYPNSYGVFAMGASYRF